MSKNYSLTIFPDCQTYATLIPSSSPPQTCAVLNEFKLTILQRVYVSCVNLAMLVALVHNGCCITH